MRCNTRRAFVFISALALAACRPSAQTESRERIKEEDPRKLGADAYIYGYPLVLMDVTRQVLTAAPKSEARKKSETRNPK